MEPETKCHTHQRSTPTMSTDHSPLGGCPDCGTEIPERRLLIEYERSDDRAVYAECPSCEEPVHPV